MWMLVCSALLALWHASRRSTSPAIDALPALALALREPELRIGICASMRDEKRFVGGHFWVAANQQIEEWLLYHRLLGASKFYVYDLDPPSSEDEDVLAPFIDEGLVIRHRFDGGMAQSIDRR